MSPVYTIEDVAMQITLLVLVTDHVICGIPAQMSTKKNVVFPCNWAAMAILVTCSVNNNMIHHFGNQIISYRGCTSTRTIILGGH